MSTIYAQTGDYMPRDDAGFRDWLANFARLISEDWSRFNLTEADARMIVTHHEAYEAAYVPVQSAETRTSARVQHKNAVKASAMKSCRVYAQLIRVNRGVSNEDRIALGLNLDNRSRTPVAAPSTAPVLTLRAALSGEHILTFADQMTPESRAKPRGVTNLDLHLHVGPAATADPDKAAIIGAYGRNPIRHRFDASQANLTATYFARWRTRRGLFGPWSAPLAMGIAFIGNTPPGNTGQSREHAPGDGDGNDHTAIAA